MRSRRAAIGTALALLGTIPAGHVAAGEVSPAVDVGDPVTVDEQPLRTAGKAAEHVSFLGVLRLRWSEGGVERSEALLVEGAGGAVMVRGESAVMASARQRLVQHGGEWDLLWPTPRGGQERPDVSRKYQLRSGPEGQVGGRSTRVVDVLDQGVLLERLHLDADTGLLLRREQFDRGVPLRSIGFETVTIGNPDPAPSLPARVVNAAARPVTARDLPGNVAAPAALGDGYQRLGLFRRSGVTQVLYSDGLYDLSVFQQEGRLDRSDLPGGDPLSVAGRPGWHYVWPGGHLVLWEARGVVHTAVSDAPLEQVLAAIRSIPATGGSDSLLRRLRKVCRALIQPLED